MAGYYSGSDQTDPYGYDLTISDEEQLIAVVDTLSPPAPRRTGAQARADISARVPPTTPSKSRPSRTVYSDSVSPPDSIQKAAHAVHQTLQNIDEDDLNFDIAELESAAFSHGSGSRMGNAPRRAAQSPAIQRWLAPTVSSDNRSVASFVSQTRPRSTLSVLSTPSVHYPDLSRALSDAQKSGDSPAAEPNEQQTPQPSDTRSPLLRWRTFPRKPLSVTDLTAGSWCELQHFYVLERRGGRKYKTHAMKAGSVIHEKLEREVHKPVQVDVVTKVDAFGLKIWNIIHGLRTLRDSGLTRELEVWGFIEGQLVNGIIDGLSYTNPKVKLEEDVISGRGSQPSQSSQHQLSLGNKMIFITDVKTRMSKSPPSQAQVRGTIIQLFLYHRFLSDMASGKLDYLRVFARHGLNPDEAFSDTFMAQMAPPHDDIFPDPETSDAESAATETTADFVTTVSTPSQIGDRPSDIIYTKYRTLRSLISLLKWEVQITFSRGAQSIGQIVAVEYRYRPRFAEDKDSGSIINTDSFFVEQERLDQHLQEDMKWWKGEREPKGVPIEDAFKCRTCEFVDECEWRINLDQEILRQAKKKGAEREAKRKDAKGKAEEKVTKKGGRRMKADLEF
ncbi:exonuclease V [Immersiella caudata]|uniref:Exonuclease V n=1 Tax=Immersiella caudata TaxID=314043 RepID=A0AA39WS19_9PEZI|nr:exonuclease V [Immersiella caudata]